MKRFATALIALLALVALVTAAGSLDGGVDQPTLHSGTTPTQPMPTGTPPPPAPINGTVGEASQSTAVEDGTRTAPPDTGDGGGVSSLIIAGLVGGSLVAAVLAVVLTDDDTRALPRDDDGDGRDPGPSAPTVDPAYDSPADNAVVGAWRRLTERVDGVGESTTPGEAASAAVDRGFPADAVEGITGEFETVRYGQESPDSEQERRAERLADRLDSGGNGDNGRSPGGDGA